MGSHFKELLLPLVWHPGFLLVQRDGKEDKERKTDRKDGQKEGGHKRKMEDEDRGDY